MFDVLVYSTAPLNDDLEITGPIEVWLYVATTAPSTDFTAKLVDVWPDGSAYNVSDSILRRSYEPMANDEEQPRPTEIKINLWPTSTVFFKQHRLRLVISSSNYPRFDRNPNTGRSAATETSPVAARQTIYHSLSSPARIVLPIIPANGK